MKFGWINLFNAVFVALILIPSIIYAFKFRGVVNRCESKLANALEQIGRYACMALMVLPLFVWEFGFGGAGAMVFCYISGIVITITYWIFWLLYFKKQKAIYSIMLALLPGFLFLIFGLTLGHWALVVAALIFIPSHLYVSAKNIPDEEIDGE